MFNLGALEKKEVKAHICPFVNQIWLLPTMHCLYFLYFQKHNSLPRIGQSVAFIAAKSKQHFKGLTYPLVAITKMTLFRSVSKLGEIFWHDVEICTNG